MKKQKKSKEKVYASVEEESQELTEPCPHMTILCVLGRNTVYCTANSDEWRIDYDPCAIYDSWNKIEECPMHFTREEMKERIKALAKHMGKKYVE
jgi:hypothetical protein